MTYLLFLSIAFAQEVDQYPWKATIDLSQCDTCSSRQQKTGEGTFRIPLPASLRSFSDPQDGSDLLLVNAAGTAVPFAMIVGGPEYRDDFEFLRPTVDENRYIVRRLDRPADGLQIGFGSVDAVAQLKVVDESNNKTYEKLIWLDKGHYNNRILIDPSAGPFELTFRYLSEKPSKRPNARSLIQTRPSTDPVTLTLPLTPGGLSENGWSLFHVDLPHALPIAAISLNPEERLFQREVKVWAPQHNDAQFNHSARISRVQVGGASIDHSRLALSSRPKSRQINLEIDAEQSQPLTVHEVIIELEGHDLIVRDIGPGPLTLYAGAEPFTALGVSSDLVVGLPELAREAKFLPVSGVQANEEFSPLILRSGVALPGAALSTRKYSFQRTIEGAPGLGQFSLPQEVLVNSRSDLGDIRLVTADNAQVPYLTRSIQHGNLLQNVSFKREERGSTSRIIVETPDPNLPLNSLNIFSDATTFRRTVKISRANGAQLDTIRAVDWSAQNHTAQLGINLSNSRGGTLVIEIENEDNPPIAVTRIDLTWPKHEVLAWFPEEETRLIYGNPKAGKPSYDLEEAEALLGDDTLVKQTLSEPTPLSPDPRSWLETGLVLVALGFAGLGMVALLLRVILIKPEEGPEEPKEGKEQSPSSLEDTPQTSDDTNDDASEPEEPSSPS